MPEPKISERADDLVAQLQAIVNSLPTYGATRPAVSIGAVISLARMVADLAREVEGRA